LKTRSPLPLWRKSSVNLGPSSLSSCSCSPPLGDGTIPGAHVAKLTAKLVEKCTTRIGKSLHIIPNSGNTFAVSPASRADVVGLYLFLRPSSNRRDRNHECKRRSGCRCTSEISRCIESVRHRGGDEALSFRWRVYAAAQPFQYRCRCGPQSVLLGVQDHTADRQVQRRRGP